MYFLGLTFIYGSYFVWNKHWYSIFIRQDSDHKHKTRNNNANMSANVILEMSMHHYPASKGPKLLNLEGHNKAFQNVLRDVITDQFLWNILSQQSHNSVERRHSYSAKQCLFPFQASVKLWTCDSSWIGPVRELVKWRSEACSGHSFKVKLKTHRKWNCQSYNRSTPSLCCILVLTQKVTEVGKKTIKCLTTTFVFV